MSNIRELSQLASVIVVGDANKNVGIGSTNPTSKLSVGGDAYVSGIVTAIGGFNLGISSAGSIITSGPIKTLNFIGSGNTFSIDGTTVDIGISGGGGGSGSIGIGSTFPGTPASIDPEPINGDLFFHIDYGRTFIYYDETTLGVGSSAYWIDSSPFNQSILQSTSGIEFSSGSSSSPSLYFQNDNQTGIFSPNSGEITIVSTGNSIFNANESGIVVTGIATATNYVSLSDVNLKENIQTVDNALDIVNNLRGVRFEWKEDKSASYGVIAQELEQILPELVTDTNPKTVNYNGIIGILIEGMKQQKLLMEDMQNKIIHMENALGITTSR